MKNVFKYLSFLLVLSITSCEKEIIDNTTNVLSIEQKAFIAKIESNIKNNQIYSEKSSVTPNNLDNPYDFVGIYAVDVLKYVNSTQIENNTINSYEEYWQNYKDYSHHKPLINTMKPFNSISLFESSVIKKFMLIYNIEDLDKFIINSKELEKMVVTSNLFNVESKKHLLYLISNIKHVRYFLETEELIINSKFYSNNSAGFKGCCRSQLSAIFDNNNPVDDALFIAGIPESWLAVVAYCAYEVAFNLN